MRPDGARSAHYVRLLTWLLIPAAFFNGFDSELRAVLLPELQRSFHVTIATIGLANIPIGAGSFAVFFSIRLADRVGRRPLLLISLFGYAAFTGLTATSDSVWSFALFQSLSQVFIGTEFALAALLIAEEVGPDHRGRALGRLLVAAPLGVLLAAGLQATDLSWRSIYLIGVLPVVGVGFARRMMRESVVFSAERPVSSRQSSLRAVFVAPWRARVLALGTISFLEKIPVTAGAGWWVYYAKHDLGYSKVVVVVDLAIAVGIGSLGYIVCGRVIHRFGRRPTATAFLVMAAISGALLFRATVEWESVVFLVASVFFGLGIGPALTALATESFPTRIRAQAGAAVGNGFATAGQLAGPAIVGVLGERTGLFGGIGGAVTVLTPLLLVAIPVLWKYVPETRGTHLDALEPNGLPSDQLSVDT